MLLTTWSELAVQNSFATLFQKQNLACTPLEENFFRIVDSDCNLLDQAWRKLFVLKTDKVVLHFAIIFFPCFIDISW